MVEFANRLVARRHNVVFYLPIVAGGAPDMSRSTRTVMSQLIR
jgi:hypothetical protein